MSQSAFRRLRHNAVSAYSCARLDGRPLVKNPRICRALLATVLLSASAATLAHHSPVEFNTSVTDFTLKGTIERVGVRNPHSVMELRVGMPSLALGGAGVARPVRASAKAVPAAQRSFDRALGR